jgi:3-deoxy-manno-octulosonate cytidylyltransferase (CMP-KDO synthetase)
MITFLGIIPARYASTRFPGKPLANVGGKPMIQRVYEQACMALDTVYVATDDARIEEAVHGFEGKVVMTSPHHPSGTDRCAEAAKRVVQLERKSFDVVINIQGDEPFIDPDQIREIMGCFDDPGTTIATLVRPAQNEEEIRNPNQPKVVINREGEAMYFSRSPIPFLRNASQDQWLGIHPFYIHVGMYAYRCEVLNKLTNLTPTPLEKAESLEQLRWLENGYTIKTAISLHTTIAIDTPADLDKIANLGLS